MQVSTRKRYRFRPIPASVLPMLARAEALALSFDALDLPEGAEALIEALDAITPDSDFEPSLGAADRATGEPPLRLWDNGGNHTLAGWHREFRHKWDQTKWACGTVDGRELDADLEEGERDEDKERDDYGCCLPDHLEWTPDEIEALKLPPGKTKPAPIVTEPEAAPAIMSATIIPFPAWRVKGGAK